MNIVYDLSTGEVIQTIGGSAEFLALNIPSGTALYRDDDIIVDNYYFPAGIKTARPKMSLTVGKRTIAERENTEISGIPSGAEVTVMGYVAETCSDGDVLFNFDDAGTYEVFIILFPYKSERVIYNVY